MPHGSHHHSGHHHHHGHHHAHHHGHHHHDPAARNIGLAFWLNLGFAVIELIGGVYTQSLAIVSDALHDFGDALSLGLGYVLQIKSNQGPSDRFSYGLRRLSLLSAFITGLVISVGAVYIAFESIRKFGEPRTPNGIGMFALAVLGIAVNGFAAWRMSLGTTQNEKVLRWHLIEDILGWVAVLVGSVLISAFGWTWLDPALALGISLFILYNVLQNLATTINLFLQANPDPEGLRRFCAAVRSEATIIDVHDVHFWSLDGVRHILSLHVVLAGGADVDAAKIRVRELSRDLGECHVTVEVEAAGGACADDCGPS